MSTAPLPLKVPSHEPYRKVTIVRQSYLLLFNIHSRRACILALTSLHAASAAWAYDDPVCTDPTHDHSHEHRHTARTEIAANHMGITSFVLMPDSELIRSK